MLAGRDILKTIKISGTTCSEDYNIRSAVIAYASTHNSDGAAISAKHKDQLAATDVKWSHGRFDSSIATAAANGQIVLYDLNRTGVELARLHEHSRQVHRVAFNPYQGALLLSGSQDATIRLWDMRSLAGTRSILTCQSVHKYPGNNEGVRDVRWSPTNGVEFAVGTDNGTIQRWDFRKPNAPIVKINAHEKTCSSIDWHPDGKYLASGGADKNVKVWDLSRTDRRMKASWQLRAPHSVLNVRWRPSCWIIDAGHTESWMCTQLATSYDQDPRIHIWDFRRPSIPFQVIDRYETAATDVLWHSENRLWSVGISGMFTQTDVHFVPKSIDMRSLNFIATAPSGQLFMLSEKKCRRQQSLGNTSANLMRTDSHRDSNGRKLSGNQLAPDSSFGETALLSSSFKSRHRKSMSTQSSISKASTPPSIGLDATTMKLDEAMEKQGKYKPIQHAAYGHVPGIFDVEGFKFLACHYKSLLLQPEKRPANNLHHDMSTAFEQNALLAANAGKYRLGQSWRILGLAVYKELKARANINRETRLFNTADKKPVSNAKEDQQYVSGLSKRSNDIKSCNAPNEPSKAIISALTVDGSSTMTTPIARPVHAYISTLDQQQCANIPSLEEPPDPLEPMRKTLSQRQQSLRNYGRPFRKSHTSDSQLGSSDHHDPGDEAIMHADIPETLSPKSERADNSLLPSQPIIDPTIHINDRRANLENYRPKPRTILRFDELTPNSLGPRLDRHDSGESFQMFSASTDSSHQAFSMACSLGTSHGSTRSEAIQDHSDQSMGSIKQQGDSTGSSGDLQAFPLTNPPAPAARSHTASTEQLPKPKLAPDHVSLKRLLSSYRLDKPDPRIVHVTSDTPALELEESSAEAEAATLNSFIFSDFEPLPEYSPEFSPPWAVASLLPFLIDYHTESLADVQLPAHLLLLLQPLFDPNYILISKFRTISILQSYHNQLVSLSLHTQAAALRNACYPLYPEVYEHGTYGVQTGGAFCTTCLKPSKGTRQGWCERCKKPWAPCPICNGEGPIFTPDVSDDSTPSHSTTNVAGEMWLWCQTCGHGSHTSCQRTWFAEPIISEGGCATQGCLHDCVTGIRRDKRLKEIEEARARSKGAVDRDEWDVGESRAVERTRLVVRTGSGVSTTGKKVRLLVPEDGGVVEEGKMEREGRESRSVP